MYYDYFSFQKPPFSISPDPAFLFLSEKHRDALAHLIYGASENGGFILLTGQVGTGKTTLIRSFLGELPSNIDVALCLYSGLSTIEFVATILDELHIRYDRKNPSLKALIDALNEHLLAAHAAGRKTVLVIDEGQNLSDEVLEEIRLLTNLETNTEKLLRIMLVGQEELQAKIAQPKLRQLSQRITGRYHLTALSFADVKRYIRHRLKVASGYPNLFQNAALKALYHSTKGVPRLLNVLADRALLVAYNQGAEQVKASHVKIAANELLTNTAVVPRAKSWQLRTLMIGLLLAALGFVVLKHDNLQAEIVTKLKSYQQWLQKDEKNRETISHVSHKTNAIVSPQRVENTVQNNQQINKQAINYETDNLSNDSGENYAAKPIDSTTTLKTVDELEALKIIFTRWQIKNLALQLPTANNVAAFCQAIEKSKLMCVSAQAGLPLLRLMNRPAILEIAGNWLPIAGISADNQLYCPSLNGLVVCDTSVILPVWSGKLTWILRKPPVVLELKQGFSGKQVRWLRERLAIAAGENPALIDKSLFFDEKLTAAVKAFQKKYQLETDGVVGNQTLLYLYNLPLSPEVPTLSLF